MKSRNGRTRERLDSVDLQLLKLLQEDGRMTNADLARRVKLSPPSVLQRIRRLEQSGLVSRYTAILDAEKMGYKLCVMAMVSLALHQEQPIEGFRKAIVNVPEVLEVMHVSGDFDYLLKIVVKDMADYERLVREQISTIPGVGRIQSSFVLAVNKNSTALPL